MSDGPATRTRLCLYVRRTFDSLQASNSPFNNKSIMEIIVALTGVRSIWGARCYPMLGHAKDCNDAGAVGCAERAETKVVDQALSIRL